MLKDFVSNKTGRKFEAFLVLKDGDVKFEFAPRQKRAKTEGSNVARTPKEPPVKVDFTGQEPVGKCPVCGARVFESETQFLCEHVQRDERPCKFKSGKVILEQPISREQMARLLAGERTDLLMGFISRKTGRPFSAFLVLDEKRKVAFEFPVREDSGTP